MLNEDQQILEQIKRAKEILITTKSNFSGDGLSACLALSAILEKIGKNNTVVINNFKPGKYKFLPYINKIKPNLHHLKKFIIRVNTSHAPIEELAYDKTNGEILIYLTPKTGNYTQSDVKLESSDYKYDLIFVLDSPDLESLGDIYDNNTDFFFNTPVINIDHSPANEYFGQINKIELTAVAVSEIIYSLIKKWKNDLIDEQIATYLYTGLVEKTKSFRNPQVTPHTLSIASQLINYGADREKIITNLYRTKSVSTLRLWGRALARLQIDAQLKLGWTIISQNDLELSGANIEELQGLIDEILSEVPQINTVVIFVQQSPDRILVYVYTSPALNAMYLTKQFNPKGDKSQAYFIMTNKKLAESENEVIEYIKNSLHKISQSNS